MLSPTLEALAKEFAGRLKIAKLNVDQNPVIASQYNVMSLPTLLFFKYGKLDGSLFGAVPKDEIVRKLGSL
jgi:thioredoxin-like negative regulator of GroEL